MSYQARAPRSRHIGLSTRELRFVRPPKPAALNAQVVVVMALRNQAEQLPHAMASVLNQTTGDMPIALLLLDDSSTDGWESHVEEFLADERVAVLHGCCGSPAQARNALLDMAEIHFPQAGWVARLDADDVMADPLSLLTMVQEGERTQATYVLGSNHLTRQGQRLPDTNFADPRWLKDRDHLVSFIEAFCEGRSIHELPSCNLLLRQHSGIRYPLLASAEDHWLVASLLMFRAAEGVVVPQPVYCSYRLDGGTTAVNLETERWRRSRDRLKEAARRWHEVQDRDDATLLGFGMEGVVWASHGEVQKRFYSWSMTPGNLREIQRLVSRCPAHFVEFQIVQADERALSIGYPQRALRPLPPRMPEGVLREFLTALWCAGVVTSNIKRDNLRLDAEGRLVYIDIGSDICPLSVSRFLDASARLYATTMLGWSDFELSRRHTERREEEVLEDIPGFADFYRGLIAELHPAVRLPAHEMPRCFVHDDVTLLIKACPQDAGQFTAQVRHLVGVLTAHTSFGRRVLLIDPFEGPYLRQYAPGDLPELVRQAANLQHAGWVDEVWVAPQTDAWAREINGIWFGAERCGHSHTVAGAPVTSQIWAFDRVSTRYVLQMDVDVLVGQRDASHDYLGDMCAAIRNPGVWCVGFNIPQADANFKAYASRPQGFVPEIRMGLLDLHRIKARRPFSNPLQEGRLTLMWHRALESAQRGADLSSVRGGDPRTFYVHPMNRDKRDERMPIVRDLVAQGLYPAAQASQWDLDLSLDWEYPTRHEDIVFLLFGRNTAPDRLDRCLQSLRMQSRQDFGIIMIDDASDTREAPAWHLRFGTLAPRVTLVRRPLRQGYLANFELAIRTLCTRSDTLLVVLDQDDALMSSAVVDWLWDAWNAGADLIQAPMWRPDKPLRRYLANFVQARSNGGGNVWAHLRAFRKGLYERIPASELDWPVQDGDVVSDYLTMLPMSELAECPVALETGYAYLHERSPYSAERRLHEHDVLRRLFDRPALAM